MWSRPDGSSVVALRLGCLVAAAGLLLAVGSCGGAETSPPPTPETSPPPTPETSPPPTPEISTADVEGMVLQASQAPAGTELVWTASGPDALALLGPVGEALAILERAGMESAAVSMFATPGFFDDLTGALESGGGVVVTGAVRFPEVSMAGDVFGPLVAAAEKYVRSFGETPQAFEMELGDQSIGFQVAPGIFPGGVTVIVWRTDDMGLVAVAQGNIERATMQDIAATVQSQATPTGE